MSKKLSKLDIIAGVILTIVYVPLSLWGGAEHWAGATDFLPLIMLLVGATYVIIVSIKLCSPLIGAIIGSLVPLVAIGPSLFLFYENIDEFVTIVLLGSCFGFAVSGISWFVRRKIPEMKAQQKQQIIEAPRILKNSLLMKSKGIWICSILLVIGGLLQFLAMVTGTALLGFVSFGSLFIGLAMFAAAYGIWKLKKWGRILGVILGILEVALGGIMGGILMSLTDILLGMSGLIIVYFLLVDKNTKTLFRGGTR